MKKRPALQMGLGLFLAATLVGIALRQLHRDLATPSQCQTTYIWQARLC